MRPAAEAPYPVGSLQKPFVAKAWARSHPGQSPPPFHCDAASGCWRPSGHGPSGLARALAVSCNAYFRSLAAGVPREVLESTLAEEGFAVPNPLTPEAAIGLPGEEGAAVIRPSALLRAYRRLTREPWEVGEAVRQEVLAGLRESALSGTARGIGRRGYWTKTGTVPALDGRERRTSGWAVAVDDSGWGILGLLEDGTGREAAAALSGPLARLRPWTGGLAAGNERAPREPTGPDPARGSDRIVRVSLFGLLPSRTLMARNAGVSPASSGRGFVGPGGAVGLRPGDRLGEGLWELSLPTRGFVRRIRGSLACEGGPGGALRLRAEMSREEYVAGVLRAELPEGDAERRVALGAAVLRFLESGPRHGDVDVCDATHCAWFVGRGPRLFWPTPAAPVVRARLAGDEDDVLYAAAWRQVRAAAGEDGPRHWTSHCGGEPLSPHFLWGNGDHRVWPCPRHASAPGPAWARRFTEEQLRRAFGAPVTSLSVVEVAGVWSLRVETALGTSDLRYDEAHRRLAAVLGWSALPSPATRMAPVPGGFEAEGVGLGHRVGLCLAD